MQINPTKCPKEGTYDMQHTARLLPKEIFMEPLLLKLGAQAIFLGARYQISW